LFVTGFGFAVSSARANGVATLRQMASTAANVISFRIVVSSLWSKKLKGVSKILENLQEI
jgi:hypothetical protein